MKFIIWIFNIPNRHYSEINRYEKGGAGRKLLTLLFSLILVLGSIALEWWFISYFLNLSSSTDRYPILSLIGIGFLALAVFLYALDHCSTYAYVGFKNAIVGTAISIAMHIEKQKKKNKEKAEQSKDETVNDTQINEPLKTYKALNIFIAICNVLFIIALILGTFLTFIEAPLHL